MRPAKALQRIFSYTFFEGRPLATKGRWINPLVFALFRLIRLSPSFSEVKSPIFIVGTGRSGTTILGVVMSMHRDVGFLNEPKALWHAVYPLEDLIGNYASGEAKYRLQAEDATPEVCQKAHQLFGAYLALSRARRVVDKYPELVFRIPFIRAIFPDARFLFLVRNGWDTCRSIEGWSSRKGLVKNQEVHDWWGVNNRKWHLLLTQVAGSQDRTPDVVDQLRNISDHGNMAALEWALSMREGLTAERAYPQAVLRVSFEELTRQPQEVLTTIREFCELPRDETFMSYGMRTLRPLPSRQSFPLHPALRGLFAATMADLGYDTSPVSD